MMNLLEQFGFRRPVRHEILERVAMEPQVVSPIVHLLFLHVETRRQPHLLRGVIGIQLRLLLRWQLEELHPNSHHFCQRLLCNSVIYNLRIDMKHKELLKRGC